MGSLSLAGEFLSVILSAVASIIAVDVITYLLCGFIILEAVLMLKMIIKTKFN